MSLRKPFKLPNRSSWYIEVDRKRRSLGTPDKDEAEALFKEIRRRYLAGEMQKLTGQPVKAPITLSQFETRYSEWAEPVQPFNTFAANVAALKKLSVRFGHFTLTELTKEHPDKVVAAELKRGLKPGSVNVFIRHIKSVLNKAVEWQLLPENPFTGLKQLKANKRKIPKHLTADQVNAFLKSIEDRDLRLMATAYCATGRRRTELVNLKWKDVNLNAGVYTIRNAKDHLTREYPINRAFLSVLQECDQDTEHVFNRWKHPHTITHKIRKALDAAGHADITLHGLRHSFGAMFVEHGGDVRVLMELLGHSRLSTTMIYNEVSGSRVAQEAERIRFDLDGA